MATAASPSVAPEPTAELAGLIDAFRFAREKGGPRIGLCYHEACPWSPAALRELAGS